MYLNSSHGHVCEKEYLRWELPVRTPQGPQKFMPYLPGSIALASPLFQHFINSVP